MPALLVPPPFRRIQNCSFRLPLARIMHASAHCSPAAAWYSGLYWNNRRQFDRTNGATALMFMNPNDAPRKVSYVTAALALCQSSTPAVPNATIQLALMAADGGNPIKPTTSRPLLAKTPHLFVGALSSSMRHPNSTSFHWSNEQLGDLASFVLTPNTSYALVFFNASVVDICLVDRSQAPVGEYNFSGGLMIAPNGGGHRYSTSNGDNPALVNNWFSSDLSVRLLASLGGQVASASPSQSLSPSRTPSPVSSSASPSRSPSRVSPSASPSRSMSVTITISRTMSPSAPCYTYLGAATSQSAARASCQALTLAGGAWDLPSFSNFAEVTNARPASGLGCGGQNAGNSEQWTALGDAGVGGSYNPGLANGGLTWAGWYFQNGATTEYLVSAAGQALWDSGEPRQDATQRCATFKSVGLKMAACSYNGLGTCCMRVGCIASRSPSPSSSPSGSRSPI